MAILHVHRQHIMLLERARVRVEDGRLIYEQADDDAHRVHVWNIPSLNSAAILLGQGSSLSQAAARKLHDDGVMLAFTGSEGTPLLMASQDFRPTRDLQIWVQAWSRPEWRLASSKKMQEKRCSLVRASWEQISDDFLGDPNLAVQDFERSIKKAESVEQLMGSEGKFVKSLYSEASKATGVRWAGREPGKKPDLANEFLDQGNYLAYGLAAATIWALGIPAAFPVTHGATRAGGLVFDLADVIKDAIVLPTAFEAAGKNMDSGQFRHLCTERLFESPCLGRNGALGVFFETMSNLITTAAEQ